MIELNEMNWFERQGYRQGYQEGWADAEERIIKALTDCECHPEDEGNCFAATYVCDVVALIKGKNETNPWTSRPLTEEDIEHYG